ncbi:MAG TPA: acyl-CoA synthetase [Actinomycetota bacterium]|nr:acyl-CoA synthetase [Actinomycetota bacterium]
MSSLRQHRPGSYEEMVASFTWEVPERYNIGVDTVDKHEDDRLAMLWEDWEGNERRVTFGDMKALSNRIANVLADVGVERGDRVAVMLPSVPETAAAFIAAFKLGAVLLSLSQLYGDDGIAHRLSDSEAKVLITDGKNRGRLEGMGDRVSSLERVVVLNAGDSLAEGDLDLDEAMAAASDEFTPVDTAAEDPAQLYYSSGTTGQAKGILHAHRYLLGHNEYEFCHDVRDDEVFHSTGEWAWIAGIVPGLLGPWRYGVPVAVFERKGGAYDPAQTFYLLEKYKVGNLFTTPTALRAMTQAKDPGSQYDINLRIACSAGEPLNPEVIRWFQGQFGIPVLDYYGLTESYPLCGNFPTVDIRHGSMGKPLPGWEIKLLEVGSEQEVARGEAGEICLVARSNPHYPLGYWNRPEDTEEVFGGHYFRTKDVGKMDEDGYVWYEGRADDVIISAGYRIGPFEVESAILELPEVVEAAAVASPDEQRGHIVKAFVRLAPEVEGSDELVDKIKKHVRKAYAAYAYPREVEFVDDLPKTLTGKIRRIDLRNAETERKRGG